MNLFLIARDLPAEGQQRACRALRELEDVYPHLDPATTRTFEGGGLFALAMQTAEAAARPRRYRHLEGDVLTLYDGVPVDPEGGVAGHDAAALARRWDGLDAILEGQFFAARLDLAGGRLELLSDPLGRHPVQLWRDGSRLVASNNGTLLRAAAGLDGLDAVGASLFLGMGYVGGDRTLTEGVRIFPDGERWTWAAQESEPRRQRTFPLEELARRPRTRPADLAAPLAAALGAPLAELTRSLGPLHCPITAGRDSRVLVGLMLDRELPGRYFSSGEEDHEDVRGGRRVAAAFGLDHYRSGHARDVAERWHELSRRVVLQHDGLVSLAQIRNAAGGMRSPERLEVQLYGGGGEYARGKWLTPPFLLRPPGRSGLESYILRRVDQGGPLATAAVREAVRAHVAAQVERLLAVGFAPIDVPCAYFFHDYGRRWGGATARQLADRMDVYCPYYLRAYLRAAFALAPADRYGERLTYALLEHLSPPLLALPFADPWRPHGAAAIAGAWLGDLPVRALGRLRRRLRPSRAARAAPDRARQRQVWLEARLPELRAAALDDAGSPLWGVVDRAAFERLTAPSEPPAARLRHAKSLLRAFTLLRYGAERAV